MKNILVTGATGFIGLELIKQLTEKGYRPRLLIRRPSRAPLLARLNVEIYQGDLISYESLIRASRGIDTVIHLGARAIFEEYDRVKPTIVDGSVNLMKAAIEANVQRFVFASSLLVYNDQKSPIDENTPLNHCCGYGQAKMEAENHLFKMALGKIIFSAIRLPHVYGARDLMFEQIRKGKIFIPGDGNNFFANLHIHDAAAVLIAAAEENWEGMSAVADDLSIDWNAFFAEVIKYYPSLKLYKIPKPLALFATYLYTPFRHLRKEPSLYTPDSVITWNLNLPVRKGLLWELLKIKPKYPTIYEGIPEVLDDCVPFRWIHSIKEK